MSERPPYAGAHWTAPHYQSMQYYAGYWAGTRLADPNLVLATETTAHVAICAKWDSRGPISMSSWLHAAEER